MLVGARTTYTDIGVATRNFTVGARLQPGTLPALFGIPAHELTNRSVSIADVLGSPPAALHNALAAQAPHAAIRAIEAFLTDRLRASRPIDARLTTLVNAANNEGLTVRHAAESLHLSGRTVRYWSQQHVGMGMKRLWRIRRLHRALWQNVQQPMVGWARIAADAGYTDQSHLIRDCKALLGESPKAFSARAHG
ncbi:MAG: hypothetical protein RhofKO_40290 [Rhodothermales bacterium]